MKTSAVTQQEGTLLAGRQPVLEALKSGLSIAKIYLAFGTHGTSVETIRMLARRQGVPIVELDRERFDKIAPTGTTQGVTALLSHQPYTTIDGILDCSRSRNEHPFLLLLDQIEDPHNLGALLRSAECAGVHGVVLLKHHSAPITPTVVKASAGASIHVRIARETNLVATIATLQDYGIWVIGTDDKAEKSYIEADYCRPLALVVGNEGKGMRRLVKERCDELVRIPVRGNVGSLNASVAGGLVMFEVARSRSTLHS